MLRGRVIAALIETAGTAADPKRAMRIVGVTVALIAVVLIAGWVRLRQPAHQQRVMVGLITSDEPPDATARQIRDHGSGDLQRHGFLSACPRYGQNGAGLMLVPAWDFNLDRAWHGHIAIMRGVEDGFSIARGAAGIGHTTGGRLADFLRLSVAQLDIGLVFLLAGRRDFGLGRS